MTSNIGKILAFPFFFMDPQHLHNFTSVSKKKERKKLPTEEIARSCPRVSRPINAD